MISNSMEVDIEFYLQPLLFWSKEMSTEENKLVTYLSKFQHFERINKIAQHQNYLDFYNTLHTISKKYGIKIFDCNKFIKENSSRKDWLFVDSIHCNDDGNKLISKMIMNS